MSDIVVVHRLTHVYPPRGRNQPARTALSELNLEVRTGEQFCLVGPNGSGKSTLFRILSTSLRPTSGTVTVHGHDIVSGAPDVRASIGVAFQHPSLDKKLTVEENIRTQGILYGLRGETLRRRTRAVIEQLAIGDHLHDLVETLSGGYQRRVELAKCLLHSPPVLLLDEPSTGLDPNARREFSATLDALRREIGVTILITTHILEEAEHADRIAILDRGRLIASGSPAELKREIGGDIVALTSETPEQLAAGLRERFGLQPQVVQNLVRVERAHAHEFIPQVVEAFPGQIETVTLSKPSLEDVFLRHTGHTFTEP